MKLLRYGEIGKEKPGILGQDGKIRDLSNHITDINGDNISEEGLNKISMIDELQIDGDFIESQAFAFLAIRTLKNLPISFPNTTGCKKPCVGGKIIEN